MAIFKIEIPARLEITMFAADADAALRHVNTAFAHAEPIGTAYLNIILRRGESARGEVKDAIPTGEASLVEEVKQ